MILSQHLVSLNLPPIFTCSQALDFETYNSNWANMAVSMPSDFDYSDVYNATTVTSKKSLHVIVDH